MYLDFKQRNYSLKDNTKYQSNQDLLQKRNQARHNSNLSSQGHADNKNTEHNSLLYNYGTRKSTQYSKPQQHQSSGANSFKQNTAQPQQPLFNPKASANNFYATQMAHNYSQLSKNAPQVVNSAQKRSNVQQISSEPYTGRRTAFVQSSTVSSRNNSVHNDAQFGNTLSNNTFTGGNYTHSRTVV